VVVRPNNWGKTCFVQKENQERKRDLGRGVLPFKKGVEKGTNAAAKGRKSGKSVNHLENLA